MFKFIDKYKDKENVFVYILKIIYCIGKIAVVNSIIVTVLGILIPVLIENKYYIWAAVLSFILILFIILHAVCSSYQKRQYVQRELTAEILDNQSSLLNTLNIEIRSNSRWRNTVFKKISEIICEKIRNIFKTLLNCDTRVSIEYVFEKNINKTFEKHVKMAGRRSPKRDNCKNSIPLERKEKYFSYKVFTDNKIGINILSEQQINEQMLWYNNPAHTTKVKQYIGIAVSVQDDNKVDYILQIDCLDDISFGKNNTDEEIEQFINQYLSSYINIVNLSYLLNLNKQKKIPEV